MRIELIQKPYAPDALVRKVREFLDQIHEDPGRGRWVFARSKLITKALPQFCRNFILDRYPWDMEVQGYIANNALGQMENRPC
jgi:hypothetical protein